MAWREFTEDDMLDDLSGPELDAVRQRAGDDAGGDDDRFDNTIAKTVNFVRGRIQSNPANTMGAEGTLPESAILHTGAIARYRLITRIGISVSDSRQKEYDRAMDWLDRVADGKEKIELPEAGTETSPVPKPKPAVVIETTRRMDRSKLGGLF